LHPAASLALFNDDVATLTPELARRRGWILHTLEFPTVDCSFTASARTTLRVRLMCDDWNDQPPAISLLAADGSPLSQLMANGTGVFHQGPHPQTNRPFVCMRGAREYHTHPSHIADPWESLRDQSRYTLGGILTQLWHAWLKGTG
jgi:hypothetical protein